MNKLNLTGFCFVALFLGGCEKDTETGPQGPQGPAGPQGMSDSTHIGDVLGFVELYDEHGVRMYSGLSGTAVAVLGTAYQSTTDANGAFGLTGITEGMLTLSSTRTGFGEARLIGLPFVGGGASHQIMRMARIPAFFLDSVPAYGYPGNVSLWAYTVPNETMRGTMVFVGNTADVSSDPSTYIAAFYKGFSTWTYGVTQSFTQGELSNMGFQPGQTLYYRWYAAPWSSVINPIGASQYMDIATGRMVYTALSSGSMTGSIIVL